MQILDDRFSQIFLLLNYNHNFIDIFNKNKTNCSTSDKVKMLTSEL